MNALNGLPTAGNQQLHDTIDDDNFDFAFEQTSQQIFQVKLEKKYDSSFFYLFFLCYLRMILWNEEPCFPWRGNLNTKSPPQSLILRYIYMNL